ncbi:phosphohydrolase [Portibacter lacus]|uniref:Phosphohydrolase n=2 Tax=Portibacter lacus TaxID=1099794 RepID=A0AA37SV42_9BACT|nr:phosphohydrolase [Portibacter lacus]
MGLSHYVYPGALHTRFHHALGSLHLTTQALAILREKDIEISKEEAEAVSIAILLHDIGHGPFSHALEGNFIDVSHEEISLAFMEEFNKIFPGRLDLAIEIFKGNYHRAFLHQLVSSQLDMDRLDYLNRDSYFTGVAEGVISYDRIIKMLNVRDDELLIEEKGIYSIEKFILSRKLMYWQVYLHKTSIISEQMLARFVGLVKEHFKANVHEFYNEDFGYFLTNKISKRAFEVNQSDILTKYARIDDYDVFSLVKKFTKSSNFTLNFLSNGLINRELFQIRMQDEEFKCDDVEIIRLKIQKAFSIDEETANELIILGTESNLAYNTSKNEIKVLFKDNTIVPFSLGINNLVQNKTIKKFFLCYPKSIQ